MNSSVQSNLPKQSDTAAGGYRGVVLLAAVGLIGISLAQIIPAVGVVFRDQHSDLARQWLVTQYVLHRVNPYPVAHDALLAQYGVLGPGRLRDTKIYAIPPAGPHPQTDSKIGPPEATYPPGDVILLLPLGLLPREWLTVPWLLLNIVLVFPIARELRSLGCAGQTNLAWYVALVAVWPAFSACIEREQFSLLSLFCILLAFRIEARRPVIAGLLLSISLLKPSLAIPFLVLPLLDEDLEMRGRIKLLATLAASQLLLLGGMCWAVHAGPRELISGWLGVATYFRQGMYSVQDFINALHLDGTIIDTALEAGVLLGGMVAVSRLESRARLAFLSVIACLWTYHGPYDFVVLLVPAALLVSASGDRVRKYLFTSALGIVGLGIVRAIYLGSAETRPIRYAARICLIALVVGFAFVKIDLGKRRAARVSAA